MNDPIELLRHFAVYADWVDRYIVNRHDLTQQYVPLYLLRAAKRIVEATDKAKKQNEV